MKITYKRELKHNYLIVEPEEVFYDSYELRMMASNCIDGLLKFHIKQVDSRKSYYYEITSRQPLSRLLECHNIGAGELKCLVSGIVQTISRLEAYLLQEEQILLEPDFIYVEPERYETSLCLVPGKQGDFPEDMTNLLQYLLGKVDHQDKECVVLAYGLYQESLKENYGLDNLLRLLVKNQDLNGTHVSRDNAKENMIESGDLSEAGSRGESGQHDHFINRKEDPAWLWGNDSNSTDEISGRQEHSTAHRIISKAALLTGVVAGGPLLVWFLDGVNGLANYWYILLAADVLVFFFLLYRVLLAQEESQAPSEYASGKSGRNYYTVRSEKLKGEEIQRAGGRKIQEKEAGKRNWQMTFEDEEEPAGQEENLADAESEDEVGTVLLTGSTKREGMRYLRAMGEGSEDIIISYVPFIIGKQEGLVDFVLNRETVSRLHARIDRDGEEYRITDLNSTNGTIVGERVLETNETAVLRPGDEVYIANLGFIFT